MAESYLDVLREFKFTPEEVDRVEKAYSEDLREFLVEKDAGILFWKNAEKIKKAYRDEGLIKLLAEKGVPSVALEYAEKACNYDLEQLGLLIEKGAPGEAWKYAEKACNYDLEQLDLLIEKGAPWEAWEYAEEVADVYSPKLIAALVDKNVPLTAWEIKKYHDALDEESLGKIKGAFKELGKKADRYDGESLGSLIVSLWENAGHHYKNS